MQEDFFDDNFNEDSQDREMEHLIERFDKMLETNIPVFFDRDDYALIFDHYFFTGKLNKAQKVLSLGIKQFPDAMELQLKKVHYLIYSQKNEEALKILEEADKVLFAETEMQLEQAYLYAQLNKFDKSIEKYENLLKIRDDEHIFLEDVYLGLSDVYEQMEEGKKSLHYLKKALELDPENEYLISSVSDAFYNVAKEDEKYEIVDYFINFLDKNPMSSIGWCYLGLAYMEVDLYEKAIESFDYALALDENNEEALLYSMQTYFKLNDTKKANDTFLVLMQISQFKEMVWHQLGDNLYKSGDNEGALFAFQKSIDENPNFYLSYVSKAIVYAAMENYNHAIESIDKAIALEQNNAEYWLLKSEYLCDAERNEEALLTFQYIAKHFPQESDTWLLYSDFYVSIDAIDQAIQILFEGIEKQSDNISYVYRMANYYYLKEDIIQGNSYLHLAFASNPELLSEFFEYDENMYNIPDVIEFLAHIKK
ncbi:MAG: tetratricopeptide repeat protein [Bacteroidales bacterium]|nr:tetratricopeptide repeat protein [Bacteroidales bacterium]MDD4210226.1 tetratricopeptide repeat protein [Bacteroidales bacterium]